MNFYREIIKWHEFILLLAFSDARLRYSRTKVGQFWIPISQLIHVFSIGFVMSNVWNQPIHTYLPYLAISQVAFSWISATISESPNVLINYGAYIKEREYPFFIFPLILVMKNLNTMCYNMIVVFIVGIIYLSYDINFTTPIYFLISIFLVGLWLTLFVYMLGILGARYRDLNNIVNSFLPLLYLLTPILWKAEQLPELGQMLLLLNPIYIALELIRLPLYGAVAEFSFYVIILLQISVLKIILSAITSKKKNYIIYWL